MLAIVDGADYEASSCGFIDMGTSRVNVPRCCFKDWQQKRSLYIYLESGGSGVTFKMESSYPTPTDSKLRRLIARLIYKNGAYSVIQEQHGPISENYHMMLGGLSVIG